MNRFSDNYKFTGSKSREEIVRDAYIVNTLSVSADGTGEGFRHEYAFVVSKSRGRDDFRTVKGQLTDGHDIKDSFIQEERHLKFLTQYMPGSVKLVQASKKRVEELAYLNSLLDSCFKGWH